MSEVKRLDLLLIFYVSVSFFGLLTVSVFALNEPRPGEHVSWMKPLISFLFSSVCVSGAVATLFPQKCLTLLGVEETRFPSSFAMKDRSLLAILRSHHPECSGFSHHTLAVRGRILCAGCAGLFTGAIIATIGTILYSFCDWRFDHASLPLILFGQIGVFSGFSQMKFKGFLRLALNVFFVLGAYLILIGLNLSGRRISLGIYFIVLVFFLIWTRILLSRWHHSKICHSCNLHCDLQKK